MWTHLDTFESIWANVTHVNKFGRIWTHRYDYHRLPGEMVVADMTTTVSPGRWWSRAVGVTVSPTRWWSADSPKAL